MGGRDNVLNRDDGTDGVAGMGDRDDLGARRKHLFEAVEEEIARLVGRYGTDDRAGSLGNHLPRDDIGVVFERGDQDLVARLEVGAAPTAGDEVDPLGHAAHEDDFLGIARIDEGADLFARAFEIAGRGFAERIDAAVDIGVFRLVAMTHGVDHGPRFLRAGGAVEEDQRFAVHGGRQNGEVGADPRDIEGIIGWDGARGVSHRSPPARHRPAFRTRRDRPRGRFRRAPL